MSMSRSLYFADFRRRISHYLFDRTLDVSKLADWLSRRQHAPEGGLAGRTNKVVDGCYSHWIGGCWALTEAAMTGPRHPLLTSTEQGADSFKCRWNKEALLWYILCCCQNERGGLRDKPSKYATWLALLTR